MTLDDLFLELSERGYYLHYLRGDPSSIWETCVTKALEQKVNGYVNAVGYGQSRISAATALEYAIEAIEKDPSIETHEYQLSNIAPDLPSAHFDIMSIVLGDQPATFKRRQIV